MNAKLRTPLLFRMIGMVLVIAVLNLTAACTTIFGGMSQTVVVRTNPPGGYVYHEGIMVPDGGAIVIDKKLDAAKVRVMENPFEQELRYDPNLWLIGDGVLCLIFLIPGLVALGIDFGTGSWRKYEDVQVIQIPNTAVAPRSAAPPADGQKKATEI